MKPEKINRLIELAGKVGRYFEKVAEEEYNRDAAGREQEVIPEPHIYSHVKDLLELVTDYENGRRGFLHMIFEKDGKEHAVTLNAEVAHDNITVVACASVSADMDYGELTDLEFEDMNGCVWKMCLKCRQGLMNDVENEDGFIKYTCPLCGEEEWI